MVRIFKYKFKNYPSVQSMNTILDRIDAELKEQIDNSTFVDEQNSKPEITKEDPSFSPAGQSFLNDNQFGIRLQKMAFVKKSEPSEIRRHPSRNDYGNNGNKFGNVFEEDSDAKNMDKNKAIEEQERPPTMTYGE
jgi:hypothetical protein